MSSRHVQFCIGEKKTKVLSQELMETHRTIVIIIVQICLHCGRKFPLKRGRKKCPNCQGLLRNKTTVLKAT